MTPEQLRQISEQYRAMLGVTSQPISKSDDIADAFPPSAVRVGTGGTVVFLDAFGKESTWLNVADGTTLDVLVTLIKSTGTTASDFHRIT